ncbi:putative Exo-beta-1,3-glucanae [Biscogniauxia mediterranea]|nr:putative Exo-beta-1,3-glucanae [Biscogniauxia mediterranea]
MKLPGLVPLVAFTSATAIPRAVDISASLSLTPSSYPTNGSFSSPSECAYWLEDVERQGLAAFNPHPDRYQVFRNVKEFGAKGDAKTDDTRAIQNAISSGGRCAPGSDCASTTVTPAIVYFPSGTYLVTDTLVDYYYTMTVGNPNCMPIIKASKNFTSGSVYDANHSPPEGGSGWGATNVFFRQMKNLIIDTTDVSPSVELSGIHWTVSQATSLQNIVFQMSTKPDNKQSGIFIAEGSGGFFSDLAFHGGNYGLNVGNQQFTSRNLSFHNVNTAINQLWDWSWTYQGISINNCKVGLNMTSTDETGAQTVGAVVFIDSEIKNTPIGVATARNGSSSPDSGGSLILENVALENVQIAVLGGKSTTLLRGATEPRTIAAWGQGHSYFTEEHEKTVFQRSMTPNRRPESLTVDSKFYQSSKPKYEDLPVSQFISIRSAGAKGDGKTDDTEAINRALLLAAASGRVVFFDSGYYKVTSTVYIPPGSRIVGEALPVIMSSGNYFASVDSPKPVVQVGLPGQTGRIEWSDMIISTRGAQAGAVLIEYNLASAPGLPPSGIWEVHTRIGGFAGSQLTVAECKKTPETEIREQNVDERCIGAFMSMHVTPSAAGLYAENCWLWVADHDIDDPDLTQITIYAGRGLLVESAAGGIWLYGTGVEHHALYGYRLVGTRDVVMGQVQTETAYYQPNPDATTPFPPVAVLHDPVFSPGDRGLGLSVVDSEGVLVYGAGLYSFFDNYDVLCSQTNSTEDCQTSIFSVRDSEVSVYSLGTIGTTYMATAGGVNYAEAVDNVNGFVDTVAVLRNDI